MNPGRVVRRARRLAAASLPDACVISRPGPLVEDMETGKVTQQRTPVYDGACKVTSSLADEMTRGSQRLGKSFNAEKLTLQIPVGAAPVRVGDRVEVTKSENPALPGRVFRIVTIATESWAIAAKYTVEEIT